MTTNLVRITLVEDNPGDADLLRAAIGQSGIDYKLTILEDGRGAERYFQWLRDNHGDWPDWVILDVRIPYRSGLEVLAIVRGFPALVKIPVTVLTSSGIAQEQDAAATLGVRHYWQKPASVDELDDLTRKIRDFLVELGFAPKASGVAL